MNNFTRKVNYWRGRVMMALTKNVGKSTQNAKNDFKSAEQVRRVLISRPNHRLGNLLLITPLLQEVSATFPNAKIDLFVKGHLPPIIFKNYPMVDRVISLPRRPFEKLGTYMRGWFLLKSRRYDIAFNVIPDSSSGRLSIKYANAQMKFFGDKDVVPGNHVHMGKYPVHVFRESLKNLSVPVNEDRPVPNMDLRLAQNELLEGHRRLLEIVQNDRKTIALFTYATDLKRYGPDWWDEFYALIREQYPQFNIIEILPVENVSQITSAIPSFYSKDVREIAALMANTMVFIGADSGMMHLASAAPVPTIGLFKVTNANAYAPYNAHSRALSTVDLSVSDVMKSVQEMVNQITFEQPAVTA